MRKKLLAIAAAAVLASSSAWAKEHHPMTEAEYAHCLNLDFDEAGEAWCTKSDAGMNPDQIVEYNLTENKKRKAHEAGRVKAAAPHDNAERICSDASVTEAQIKGGAPLDRCITAAAAGDADGMSAKCIALTDEAMILMDRKKHECMVSLGIVK